MAKKPVRKRSDAEARKSGRATSSASGSTGSHSGAKASGTAKRATRAASARRRGVKPTLDDFVAIIPSVPASELRLMFAYDEPFAYKPHTQDLSALRMELDDIQVLRYLFRNARPRRHLEFGTWEGRSALACLEESDASVWTINLLDGEENGDGSSVYGRTYLGDQQNGLSGRYHVVGTDDRNGGIVRSYRTDGQGFVGRYFHSAGLGHRVCQIYADSHEWDPTVYPADFFDTVLIDGGHDLPTVVNDTRKALSRLRPGGLAIWHDFCPEPSLFNNAQSSCHGVVSALAQIWDEIEPGLTQFCWVEGTWLLVAMRAGIPAPAPALDAARTQTARRDPKSQSALLASGVASIRRELDTLAGFHAERERLNDELTRARADKAALERRLSGYAALVQERDLLVARNADLVAHSHERAELAEERNALQTEAADLKSQIGGLEMRVSGYASLTAERDSLADRVRELADERDRLATALRESDAERSEARRAAEDIGSRFRLAQAAAEDRQSAIDRLQEQFAERREAFDTIQAERDRLRSDLAAREDRIARLSVERHERDDSLAALQRDNATLEAAATERAARLADLDARAAHLADELAARSQELESQKQALMGHNRQSETLAAELAALSERHKALEQNHAELRDAHAALEARNETLLRDQAKSDADLRQARNEADLRGRESAALEARVAALNEMVSHLQAARDDLEAALAARARELESRAADIAERERRIDEMGRQVEHYAGAAAQADGDRATLAGELAEARAAMTRLQAARRGLAGDLVRQKSELAALTAQLGARTAQLDETGRRVAALGAERDRLLGHLSTSEHTLRDLTERFEQRDRAVVELTQERDGLRIDLDRRGAEIDDLAAQRDRLSGDLQRGTAELSALSTQRQALLGEIETQHRSLGHFDRVLAQFRRENEDLRAAIDDYTSSHSWRLTAPLRMVTSLFRR